MAAVNFRITTGKLEKTDSDGVTGFQKHFQVINPLPLCASKVTVVVLCVFMFCVCVHVCVCCVCMCY